MGKWGEWQARVASPIVALVNPMWSLVQRCPTHCHLKWKLAVVGSLLIDGGLFSRRLLLLQHGSSAYGFLEGP